MIVTVNLAVTLKMDSDDSDFEDTFVPQTTENDNSRHRKFLEVFIYDYVRRNLNKCWAQLCTKVTPTSDDLLTSNLFYSRITIVRNKKFEFEGILITISILF